MKNVIEGYKELEQKLGYELCFHDHRIVNCVFEDTKIAMEIKTDDGVEYSLIFEGVEKFDLKGFLASEVGIIDAIEIQQIKLHDEDMLHVLIESSIGFAGDIICKQIISK